MFFRLFNAAAKTARKHIKRLTPARAVILFLQVIRLAFSVSLRCFCCCTIWSSRDLNSRRVITTEATVDVIAATQKPSGSGANCSPAFSSLHGRKNSPTNPNGNSPGIGDYCWIIYRSEFLFISILSLVNLVLLPKAKTKARNSLSRGRQQLLCEPLIDIPGVSFSPPSSIRPSFIPICLLPSIIES